MIGTAPAAQESDHVMHSSPDLRDHLRAVLDLPSLSPVNIGSVEERRLWRACELAIFAEYRLAGLPDPRGLSDTAIADGAARALAPGERLGDPADLDAYLPYWLVRDGQVLGTVALALRESGWDECVLWIASLFLFREARRQGHASRIIADLVGLARRMGLGGIRLETDWTWQGALHLYLRLGFGVANWKRGLSLVRYLEDPIHALEAQGPRLAFVRPGKDGRRPLTLLRAGRSGDRLRWEDLRAPGAACADTATPPRLNVESTFALCLAMRGWPLIRSPEDWAQRDRWCDVGMPEGLAEKIGIFEAYSRHCGFRVRTPRIPGLVYPTWEELRACE